MSGIATYHTDRGGQGKDKTRYWIHTYSEPAGYAMEVFCQWSAEDARETIKKIGCEFVEPLDFLKKIAGDAPLTTEMERNPTRTLKRIGAESYGRSFRYSPFAIPY